MTNTTYNGTKDLRFFKQDGCWYADVPGHDLADNEMVAGADTFLEAADRILGRRHEVNVTFSDNNNQNSFFLAKLERGNHDDFGATYSLTGPLAQKYNAEGFQLWICNVTHDVMGEHPQSIFIYNIR